MSVSAVAFVPATPLLVPAVAAGAAYELDDLRIACAVAIERVRAASERLVLVGATPRDHGGPADFRPYGVDLVLGTPGPPLPPDLAVGRWLVGDGAAYGEGDGWVVVGDGSARRSTAAPGYYDPAAEAYDAAVARALATGDAAALRGLDPDDLLVAGTAAWRRVPDGPWRAELLYDAAPYGVGYFVATWLS